jgi:hypothetical protein
MHFVRAVVGYRMMRHKSKEIGELEMVNVKVKVTEHHAMKPYGEMEVELHAFLTSAVDGGEWLVSCPRRFTPGKEPLIPSG